MKFNCKSLFFLFLSLLFIPNLMAQEAQNVKSAKNAIQKLKNGVLVVRLESKNNKVKELNRLIASQNVSVEDKEDLELRLHKTVSDVKSFNTKLYYAFSNVYDFSEVLFIYDTASVSLKKGIQQGYFLDENLKVSPNISLDNRNFYLLRNGSTNPNKTSGVEAFVIADDQFKDLNKPFPYYMKLRTLGQKLGSFFSSRSDSQIKVVDRVYKLNKKLHKYFEKAAGS